MVKAATAPVPVTAQTWRPSVTGDGEVLLCLRQVRLPSATTARHSSLPSARDRHSSSRSSPPGWRLRRRPCSAGASPASGAEGEVTKTRSPQTMGVPPLQEGSGLFQRTPSAALHSEGRPAAALTPF